MISDLLGLTPTMVGPDVIEIPKELKLTVSGHTWICVSISWYTKDICENILGTLSEDQDKEDRH